MTVSLEELSKDAATAFMWDKAARSMRRAFGLPVREYIRQRVLIAAGQLNHELDDLALAKVADDLAECAMQLRGISDENG